MKKFSRLWKNLFSKYANTGFTTKLLSNFDQIGMKAQTINYPEATKLLKDHAMLPTYISKEEVQSLVKLINMKDGKKEETYTVDYNGYLTLLQQAAFLAFSRPPRDLSFLPLAESLLTLVAVFKEATRTKGQSVILYEDPDLGAVGD